MGMTWTEEQQKVIDLRDRNILVSAAAGSGKTAVLVERIIQRITDRKDPVDVDRLLVVTFTEAAAAEMKDRISAALEKKMDEAPGDVRLEQQSTLIHSASITTIHSFCLSVIRDHFHVIGIDPGFRIAEEGELKLLKQDVLGEMLELCYQEGKQEFLDFIERFGNGKNDRKTEELILKFYEYSRSYPQPEKWLDSCARAYSGEQGGFEALEETAAANVHVCAARIRNVLEKGLEICGFPDGPYMYADMLESDLQQLERLEHAQDYAELYGASEGFAWKRLSAKKDETVSPERKDQVKGIREQAKKMFRDMQETYLGDAPGIWERHMKAAAPSMEMLSELVRRFSGMLLEKKKSRNVIDFSDMEQFALAILTEEKDGVLIPSATAEEYQERFREIMIDEYQDSNLVQETILTSVSGASKGRRNIFMVGDVKQSIYSFRLSRPELFLEKYHTYTLEDSSCQRVDLHRNFRSREEVLDCVNYIFRRILKKEYGGIEYDDSAALYPGAEFPPLPEGKEFSQQAELLLLDSSDPGTEDDRHREARMIARRIRELMRTGVVLDREQGTYRRVSYRDIVILTRSIRGWAEVFTSVLAEEGIPAYSVSREGYFETCEVSVLLDYLRLLDNARQDVPLAAVLTSPFCGLSPAEMAGIRIAEPNVSFCQAVTAWAKGEQDARAEHLPEENRRKLRERIRLFLEQMNGFREKVPYTPIHDLLTEIIETTGYDLYISAMPGGSQRLANVEMLVEKAAAFEGTSYKGLFHFIRYIEQLKKYDVDYGEAGTLDELADTVRIMSIHKSKGLEFPVVFAAGLGKPFNLQDTKAAVILHPELGAGLDDIDLNRRTKTPTLLKRVMKEAAAEEVLAEEMRILYVALTRAREKLILTGCTKTPDFLSEEKTPAVPMIWKAGNCLDWILPALAGEEEEKLPVRIHVFTEEESVDGAIPETAGEMALDVLKNWDISGEFLPGLGEQLDRQIHYVYPYRNSDRMKLKFTVSELKKRSLPDEEAGEVMYREPEAVPLIPDFLKEKDTLTGASRGSAYHKLMELLDFTVDYDEASLRAAVESFREAGKLTGEMAECIRIPDILAFLNTESGKRMSAAAGNGALYREQPFVMGMNADVIYPEDCCGEQILVQGIIDVYFEEEGSLTVLDYKTDQVSSGPELSEKYHAQLDYYSKALEQLTGKPVKERIIYSFTLEEEIYV